MRTSLTVSRVRRDRYKYFTKHTEIAWSKSVRATFDHSGEDERKANAHDSRLLYSGIRERNKKPVTMFPFNFMPMQGAALPRTGCTPQAGSIARPSYA